MNERTIFLSALEFKQSAERAAYLDEACAGLPGMRERVEALLRAHENERHVLEALARVDERMSSGSSMNDVPRRKEAIPPEDLGFLGPCTSPECIGSLGSYDILEVIGTGGMGIVFKARDTRLQRIVAIKVLAPEIAANKAAKRRFEREAQAAAAVSHDHIVTIHAVDEHRGLPFLVMECIVGRTLQQKIEETGPLELKEILRIGMQAAQGLAAAHTQGLVHRDIKPANILLQNGIQRVKITDFGLARAIDDVGMTHTGQIAGTPMYMSPEQAQGLRVDHLSDLFSLGSVIYTMCTGRPAFRAQNTVAVLKRVVEDTPRPMREVDSDLPPWLETLVSKLMAKAKEDRFQSAAEVADVLSNHLARLQEPKSSTSGCEVSPVAAEISGSTRLGKVPDLALATMRPARKSITSEGCGDWWQPLRRWTAPTWTFAGVLVAGMLALLVWMSIVQNHRPLMVGVQMDESRPRSNEIHPTSPISPAAASNPVPIPGKQRPPAFRSPEFNLWARDVASRPCMKQVEAVRKKLMELNPAFNGEVISAFEQDVVTGLEFLTDDVTDISPVRALVGLRSLRCSANWRRSAFVDLSPLQGMLLAELNIEGTEVSDLSPLKGLPLTVLKCGYTPVHDLSPLKSLKLVSLNCWHTPVSDLSPLNPEHLSSLEINGTAVKDLHALENFRLKSLSFTATKIADLTPLRKMPLEGLDCALTPVSDLSPLMNMKLQYLNCGGTQISSLVPLMDSELSSLICADTLVSDLSPLRGKKLTSLYCGNTRISDLSPLMGMPLVELYCQGTPVKDYSPLKGMPLLRLELDFVPARDADIVRSLKALQVANGKPVAEFWMEMDSPKGR